MPIRFIQPGETHALRQAVLRPGRPASDLDWPKDRAEGTFHVGFALEDAPAPVSVATFVREHQPHLPGQYQYRLRGMATTPHQQGLGFGAQLLRFGIGHSRELGADLIWCHARERAVPFYAREGFRVQGPRFDIPGIGPHHLMYLPL